MSDLQQQLNAVLSDPDMMSKIMSLAQNLDAGQSQEQPAPPVQQPVSGGQAAFPEIDISMLQKLSGLAGQTAANPNQQALLKALTPYLSAHRIGRLERAMRAARMASFATSFLGR